MAIQSGYGNPIDLLKYILACQNWGDNETGEPSASALIRTGVGISGSFDSTTLDPVRNISIRYMIDTEDKGATKDLIDKICKQFSLIKYTDASGYECVKYLFAESSDTAIPLFIVDETIEIGAYKAPDQAKLCVNPVIDYDYDYGLEKFTKSLEITNVQSTGTYSSLFTYGFEGTDGETYWNMCRNQLWPQSRHVEEMDSGLRENEFIHTYAGALFRLSNVIKIMKAATLDFTAPFAEGVLVGAGDIISLMFPHLQYTGEITYNAVVTGVTKSFSGNSVNIECMFIGENIPFGLMDTTDGENWPLINSYDPQPLQLTDGFNENGNPSDLTYIDPTARWTHITQINDDLATLISEMDNCQIGIDTTNDDFTYKNDLDVLFVGAKQKHWTGTDWLYDDADFANVNLQSLTGNRALYLDSNKRIQSSSITDTELSLLSGKNSVVDGSGTENYFSIFTAENRLGNSIMREYTAGSSCIEMYSSGLNFNGGLRIVADDTHEAGVYLGCAAGGYGTQMGQWSIYRDIASLGSGLVIRHEGQKLTFVDTFGTWTFDTINNEIPLKVASGQGFHLNIGGLSVSNGAHDNPSIQVTPITGGLEIDGYYGSVVYVNRFSPGDVNLCYAGGNVSINKAVAHERLHVGGNILADGFIRAGNFTPLQTNNGLAWIGRSTDEPIGSLTVQLGGIYESTTFRVVDNEWTKTIFSVSGLAPDSSLIVNQYGTVNIGNNLAEPWHTIYKALQIGTGLSIFSLTTTGYGYIRNNSYLNSSGQDIARYTGGSVQQNFNYDNTTWNIAPSVTAGNVLTYVEKMKLTSEWLYLYTNGLYNNGGYFQGWNNDRVNITAPAYTFLSVNACVDASTTTWKTLVTGVSSILEMGADGHLYIYQNAATTAGSQITIDPSPKIIWHSGNDGSGSGLDADLLDGYHLNQLTTSISNSGNLNLTNSISNINSFYATLNGPMGNNRWYWSINACHGTGETYWGGQIVWGMESSAYKDRMFFHSKEGGTWDDWTEILTNRLIGSRETWASYYSRTFVVGQLGWENYGNNHTIFDASSGYSPSGTVIDNSNSQVAWAATYPTLMGWNGLNTYGVRVDSARVAESSDLLDGYHGSNYLGKNGSNYYQANNWIEFTGEAPVGLYWSIGTRDAGGTARYSLLNTNDTQTYGNLAIYGYKNSWAGIVFESSNAKVTFMTRVADSFTGVYQQSNNSWQWYHDGNDFWINTVGGDGITFFGDNGYYNHIRADGSNNSSLFLETNAAYIWLTSVNQADPYPIQMSKSVEIYENLLVDGAAIIPDFYFGTGEGNFRMRQLGTQLCLQKLQSGAWVTVSILG